MVKNLINIYNNCKQRMNVMKKECKHNKNFLKLKNYVEKKLKTHLLKKK